MGCMSCAIATAPPELEQQDTEQLSKVSQNGLGYLGFSQGLHHLIEKVKESPGNTGDDWWQNLGCVVKVCGCSRADGQHKHQSEGATVRS